MARKSSSSPDYCPICGALIDVSCTAYASFPFIDGRTYPCICFVCFNVPKVWEVVYGNAENGSEDVWKGPFWNYKHLNTAKELVDNGTTDSIAIAKKSVVGVKKKITAAKKSGKL